MADMAALVGEPPVLERLCETCYTRLQFVVDHAVHARREFQDIPYKAAWNSIGRAAYWGCFVCYSIMIAIKPSQSSHDSCELKLQSYSIHHSAHHAFADGVSWVISIRDAKRRFLANTVGRSNLFLRPLEGNLPFGQSSMLGRAVRGL